MRILADENIPVVDAFFADQGSIRRLPGRAIDRAALAEVDVLLVRSVTEVSRAALAGSPVRFVGTCTIGTDHLDLDYFAEAGIAWSSAPGCNARGVVDYVLGCLLAMAEVRAPTWPNAPMGWSAPGRSAGGWWRCCAGWAGKCWSAIRRARRASRTANSSRWNGCWPRPT